MTRRVTQRGRRGAWTQTYSPSARSCPLAPKATGIQTHTPVVLHLRSEPGGTRLAPHTPQKQASRSSRQIPPESNTYSVTDAVLGAGNNTTRYETDSLPPEAHILVREAVGLITAFSGSNTIVSQRPHLRIWQDKPFPGCFHALFLASCLLTPSSAQPL